MLHQTFLFLGQLLQLFEVSQILEFLRYFISVRIETSHVAVSNKRLRKFFHIGPDDVAISVLTVKILKFGTPQTIAIIVLKLVKFDVKLH